MVIKFSDKEKILLRDKTPKEIREYILKKIRKEKNEQGNNNN